jgi:putative acetyltransferase
VKVSIESPDAPGVTELLTLSDEFHAELYPPESCYLLDASELKAPGVTVVVARDDETAVGMGALVERGDGTAEIKRMFVRPEARNSGTASDILRSLEAIAHTNGVGRIELETGPKQPAALAFYAKHGYARIPNFGPYVGDEFSVCFSKAL